MLLVHGRKSVDLGPLDDDVADLAIDLDLTTAGAGERSIDAVVDGAASFVADRATQFLSWRLTARGHCSCWARTENV